MQGKLKKEERNLLKEEEEHETKKIKDEIKIQSHALLHYAQLKNI